MTVTTIQHGLNGGVVRTNQMHSGFPTTNYSSQTESRMGNLTPIENGAIIRAILDFDLAPLPKDEVIVDAELTLTITDVDGNGAATFFERVLEGDFDYATSSWSEYKAKSSWVGGGAGHGSDYTTDGQASISLHGSNVIPPLALTVNIRDMLIDARHLSSGLNRLIVRSRSRVDNPPGSNTTNTWATSNYATQADRPKLVVTTRKPIRRYSRIGGLSKRRLQ